MVDGISVLLVKGSLRPGNFTSKAAALALNELDKIEGVETRVIDPADSLPVFPGTADHPVRTKALHEVVKGADGILLVTPEYHGTMSSVMKALIENMGFPSALAGKPVALMGVAAGELGAVKALEHLRSVASHVGALVLPGSVSMAGVQDAFDEGGSCRVPESERRIRALARGLVDHIRS